MSKTQPLKQPALLPLGVLTRPFGIAGGFHIHLFNPDSDTLKPGLQAKLCAENGICLKVRVREVKPGPRVFFDEIDSRTQAEEWVKSKLLISRDAFTKLEANEVYLADLIGFAVHTPDGEVLGEAHAFSSNGPQDLLEIQAASGKLVLVPFIPAFIAEIRQADKTIVLDLPGGFFEDEA